MNILSDRSDESRRSLGFLDIEGMAALAGSGAIIPCPMTTLVSPGVTLGVGVVLWPGVILQILGTGQLSVGPGAILYPGARLVAEHSHISVGAGTEIGEEGGFTIKSGGSDVAVGREVRLLGGGSLSFANTIGDGAQILGPIRCQNCALGAGGSYRHAVADERGAVLKGSGVARGINLGRGEVIQAFGLFAEAPVRRQSFFHPTETVKAG